MHFYLFIFNWNLYLEFLSFLRGSSANSIDRRLISQIDIINIYNIISVFETLSDLFMWYFKEIFHLSASLETKMLRKWHYAFTRLYFNCANVKTSGLKKKRKKEMICRKRLSSLSSRVHNRWFSRGLLRDSAQLHNETSGRGKNECQIRTLISTDDL